MKPWSHRLSGGSGELGVGEDVGEVNGAEELGEVGAVVAAEKVDLEDAEVFFGEFEGGVHEVLVMVLAEAFDLVMNFMGHAAKLVAVDEDFAFGGDLVRGSFRCRRWRSGALGGAGVPVLEQRGEAFLLVGDELGVDLGLDLGGVDREQPAVQLGQRQAKHLLKAAGGL